MLGLVARAGLVRGGRVEAGVFVGVLTCAHDRVGLRDAGRTPGGGESLDTKFIATRRDEVQLRVARFVWEARSGGSLPATRETTVGVAQRGAAVSGLRQTAAGGKSLISSMSCEGAWVGGTGGEESQRPRA